MAVRLKDIAEACGMDPSTVSRALRGDPRVKEETRQRIVAIASSLGYEPNLNARSLVAGRSQTVWMLLSSLHSTHEVGPAAHVSMVLAQQGYETFIAQFHGDLERYAALLRKLNQGMADGALIIPGPLHVLTPLQRLLDQQYPLVFLDRHIEGAPVPYVTTANVDAAAELCRRCLQDGARSAVLLFPPQNPVQKARYQGVMETVKQHDIPWLSGRDCSEKLLAQLPTPIAILSTDQTTISDFLQTHQTVLQNKTMIFSVFDGWRGEPWPALRVHVCRQDFNRIAELGATILLEQIESGRGYNSFQPVFVSPLAFDLVERRF